jgi:hypothetical protein
MGEQLPRRFHTVLSNAQKAFVYWALLLIYAVDYEAEEKSFKKHPEHSYSFFLATFPLYCIVMFGCYALINIGYHMVTIGKF